MEKEKSDKSRYECTLDFIKKQIVEDAVWEEGMRIPPERQLQSILGVSRNTIRKAISILTNEGYLFTEIGRGTFVNSREFWDRNIMINKSKLIGLIVTDVKLDFGKKLIKGVEDYLQKRAYSLILCQDHGDIIKTRRYINTLIEHGVKGVILDPVLSDNFTDDNTGIIKTLDNAGIPVVLIDREVQGIARNAIVTNNSDISYRAALHLLKNGHKKIIVISVASNVTARRINGVKQAYREQNIPFDLCRIIEIKSNDNLNRDTDVFLGLLGQYDDYTAVFSLTEYCGKLAYRALLKIGKSIPGDLSFITFDHPEDSPFQEGEITYIEQPLIKMGNKAAETMISLIENGTFRNRPASSIAISSKLVPGKSIIPNNA